MLTEQQRDGHLAIYAGAPPKGRGKLLLHLNGVTSSYEQQLRDLEALVWLTLDRPLDVVGIHNSTENFRADLLESLLGKAELARFWPEHQNAESAARLKTYADLLEKLVGLDLGPEVDILQELSRLQPAAVTTAAPKAASTSLFDLDVLRRLPLVQKMSWQEFANFFYGSYPAGAPRATLRLVYELIRGIRSGSEIFVVAHSQGLIIAALGLHILQQYFGDYQGWTETIRLIGYGPAILFADLPACIQPQTILIQHRHDLVAESLSNLRNSGFWSNLQTQAKNLLENYEDLVRSINNDSHHSASLYLGINHSPAGKRSAQLISLLLQEDWRTSPLIQSLRASRIIIEDTVA
jgi:hypothetical protein